MNNNDQKHENLLKTHDRRQQERRTYVRVESPAVVAINDRRYAVSDWSAGGFKIEFFAEEIEVADCLPAQLDTSFRSGLKVSLKILVEVAWKSKKNKAVGFKFISLKPSDQQLLNHVVNDIMSGEIAAEDYMEQLSEAKDKPINIEFIRQKKGEQFASNKQLTIPPEFIILLTIGSAIIAYTFLNLYQAIIYINIKTAVVRKPVEKIISTHRGKIIDLFVKEGMEVNKGQPLLRIFDEQMAQFVAEDQIINLDRIIRQNLYQIDNLNEKINKNYLDLVQAKTKINNSLALRKHQAIELDKYEQISGKKLEASQIELNTLQIQKQELENHLQQLYFLVQNGAIQTRRLDLAKVELAGIEGKIEQVKKQIEINELALKSIAGGSFYNGDRFVGQLPQLDTEVSEAYEKAKNIQKHIVFLEGEKSKYQRENEQLELQKKLVKIPQSQFNNNYNDSDEDIYSQIYEAPVEGNIVKIYSYPGSLVNIGHRILLLQPTLAEPIIEAYLTQDQAAYVRQNDLVEIIIPELDNQSYQGQVVIIDRRGGFFDDIRGKYQEQGSINNPVYVEIKINNMTETEKNELIVGTPVKVRIKKSLRMFNFLLPPTT